MSWLILWALRNPGLSLLSKNPEAVGCIWSNIFFCLTSLYSVQGALDWLEKNQDKSMEEISATSANKTTLNDDDSSAEPPALNPGEVAKSLMCEDCGRRFRSEAQAEFHAAKTQHINFKESTEEIAPLTEEEKKAKLAELRQKLAEKRSGMSEQDKIDKKKNEVGFLFKVITFHLMLMLLFRKFDARAQKRLKISKKISQRRSKSKKLKPNGARSKLKQLQKSAQEPK